MRSCADADLVEATRDAAASARDVGMTQAVAVARAMSGRRRIVFALAAIATSIVVSCLALLAVDVYLHSRFEKSAGFNVWGYRGPAASRKRPGEYRVAVLGGSAAYGYGVNWDQAMPAVLERLLVAAAPRTTGSVSVVNLAYNNEGAFSFRYTLDDYLWLGYDLAILYEGYNDLMGDPRAPNLAVFRHDSPVFRLTGYLPIFPIVFKEKAAAMLSGGDAGTLYREGKTVFHPNIGARTTAEVLQAAAAVGQSLEQQLGHAVAEPRRRVVDAASTGCKFPWQEYCQSVVQAVQFVLRHDKQVLVVTQPNLTNAYLRMRHQEQQREAELMLTRRFGGDSRVQYVNLGPALDLADAALSFDRMHLTAAGNERVAAALVTPVVAMANQRRRDEASARH